MTTADDYIPGTSGTLQQRVREVIENEVGVVNGSLAVERANEVVGAWRETAREGARATSRQMLAKLMPGATGIALADEVADTILASIFGEVS